MTDDESMWTVTTRDRRPVRTVAATSPADAIEQVVTMTDYDEEQLRVPGVRATDEDTPFGVTD